MPVVVTVSSAILPLPVRKLGDNGEGTHWFHCRSKRAAQTKML
jgi:hypothetical protein